MLILVLIDVQYLQNVDFSFEEGPNGQNHSSSDTHHPIRSPPIPKRYLENPARHVTKVSLYIFSSIVN